MNQGRGRQVAGGTGTHSGSLGEVLRHSESAELDPASIDGLRQWITTATLEAEPTVKEAADAVRTMANEEAVGLHHCRLSC